MTCCMNFVVTALCWIEAILAKVGFTFGELLLDRVSLLILSFGSGSGILVCLLQIKHISSKKRLAFLISASAYALIGYGIHSKFNQQIAVYCERWVGRFRNLHLIGKTIGVLLVLLGFVKLSLFIEEYHGWNGFAVAFYLCWYLHITTVVKLLGWEDLLCASDSILAVTVTMFVNFPEEKKEIWQSFVVFGFAFTLLLFKVSKPLREMEYMTENMTKMVRESVFILVKEMMIEPVNDDEILIEKVNQLLREKLNALASERKNKSVRDMAYKLKTETMSPPFVTGEIQLLEVP